MNRLLSLTSLTVLTLLGELYRFAPAAVAETRANDPGKALALLETGPADAIIRGAPVHTYRIVNSYPHDPNAFTQGLAFDDGVLYEGTGRRGQSTLRKVELDTGKVRYLLELPDEYFGEGVTVYGDRLIQLTWKSRVGFVYNKNSFELQEVFTYPTEGWGITHDGKRLIMSDGTANLYFLNPETFEEIGRIEVRDRGKPVTRLNELEYIRGEIYANVWKADRIARISPETGDVASWIDLAGISSPYQPSGSGDVLNGIAYDAQNGRLLVAGKLWPKLYEIEIIVSE